MSLITIILLNLASVGLRLGFLGAGYTKQITGISGRWIYLLVNWDISDGWTFSFSALGLCLFHLANWTFFVVGAITN